MYHPSFFKFLNILFEKIHPDGIGGQKMMMLAFFILLRHFSKYLGPTKQQPFATKTENATTFSINVRNQIKVEKTKVTKVTKARANFELWSISSRRGPYAPPFP